MAASGVTAISLQGTLTFRPVRYFCRRIAAIWKALSAGALLANQAKTLILGIMSARSAALKWPACRDEDDNRYPVGELMRSGHRKRPPPDSPANANRSRPI